ncbi:MAG: inorganic phosphate transporter [Bacteroidales bacterium]|nr:inorganic phosphate transporter [Bacteroidales bacterium]
MNFYLIVVVILFALAVSDLIVGVSNDAVNFLNSAVGSNAAPRWVIFFVASLGILLGVTFSSGMMEVARKGVFHPEQFYFAEIMIIFLAVMLTDIILLDFFNTLGLPTSTTVSIVFELLGSAVGVSLIKIGNSDETLLDLGKYINSSKAFVIIGGILMSVAIAFVLGALIQYLTRLIFSFNYKKPLKYLGSIAGSFAISAITYFILIKGAKGASFITKETIIYLNENIFLILSISFIGWLIILQILIQLFKLDIPKFVVLVGTFALSMAFAGNDLVNFIGVPLAGLESFKAFVANQGISPEHFKMDILTQPVHTETYLLIIAGIVMIITLITSRKARHVTETEVNLGRQDTGDERFGSSGFARLIVRKTLSMNKNIKRIMPNKINSIVRKRFETTDEPINENAAFDTIRAAVNLTVASIIISFATSLKLPLSTTYVTFMVAMGTSLSDRAWGRDSAVYRITGVLTVIGGWFFTAIIAFTISVIIALLINFGGVVAITLLLMLAIFLIYRNHISFRKKEKEKEIDEEESIEILSKTNDIIEQSNKTIVKTIITVSKLYYLTIDGLFKGNRKQLNETNYEVAKFDKKAKKLKANLYEIIKQLQEDSIETGHYYVQVMDYLREIAHSMSFISEPVLEHVANNHSALLPEQVKDLGKLNDDIADYLNLILNHLKEAHYEELDEVIKKQTILLDELDKVRINQFKRIKKGEVNTRNSMLYLGIVIETKNLLLYVVNMLKSQRDFVIFTKQKKAENF